MAVQEPQAITSNTIWPQEGSADCGKQRSGFYVLRQVAQRVRFFRAGLDAGGRPQGYFAGFPDGEGYGGIKSQDLLQRTQLSLTCHWCLPSTINLELKEGKFYRSEIRRNNHK